jgi:hypothetical protein
MCFHAILPFGSFCGRSIIPGAPNLSLRFVLEAARIPRSAMNPRQHNKIGRASFGISMEPGGKGSFQAFKLQRSARTTVCSHSARDMAATRSIELKHDDSDTQDEGLSGSGQS